MRCEKLPCRCDGKERKSGLFCDIFFLSNIKPLACLYSVAIVSANSAFICVDARYQSLAKTKFVQSSDYDDDDERKLYVGS